MSKVLACAAAVFEVKCVPSTGCSSCWGQMEKSSKARPLISAVPMFGSGQKNSMGSVKTSKSSGVAQSGGSGNAGVVDARWTPL